MKDFASRHKRSLTKQQTNTRLIPLWLWIVSIISFAFMATWYFKSQHIKVEHHRLVVARAKINKKIQSIKKLKSQAQVKKPDYDFYTLLPKMDVVVNKIEKKTIPHTVEKPDKDYIYYLQVASFQRRVDANRMRANLILYGYNVNIKQVVARGKRWNRVYMGPYVNKNAAERVQERLLEMEIDSLLVKKNKHA